MKQWDMGRLFQMAEAAVGKALAPTVARLRAGTVKNQALCRKRREGKYKVREAVWLKCTENYKPRLRVFCHRTLCSWFTPLRNCAKWWLEGQSSSDSLSPLWKAPCPDQWKTSRAAVVQALGTELEQVLEEAAASYVGGQSGMKPLDFSKDV